MQIPEIHFQFVTCGIIHKLCHIFRGIEWGFQNSRDIKAKGGVEGVIKNPIFYGHHLWKTL